jgi:hypothetical protein
MFSGECQAEERALLLTFRYYTNSNLKR